MAMGSMFKERPNSTSISWGVVISHMTVPEELVHLLVPMLSDNRKKRPTAKQVDELTRTRRGAGFLSWCMLLE